MKWSDIQIPQIQYSNEELTTVDCPQCGDKLYTRTDIVLTSNPPQYIYNCHSCGWTGTNWYWKR